MFYTPLSVFSLRNSVCRILNYVYMIHLKTIRVNPVQTEIMFFFQCQNVLISILPAHQKCSVIRLSEQINYTFQSILLCFKGVLRSFDSKSVMFLVSFLNNDMFSDWQVYLCLADSCGYEKFPGGSLSLIKAFGVVRLPACAANFISI